MPANPWELRADVRPLEVAAQRWSEVALVMAGRAEELVGAARHATDGWDADAAESFDAHRREVLMNLDHFTTLAEQMASSLRAVAEMMLAGQAELDREWNAVALVPHEVVGESRHLVFRPDRDEDRSLVTRAQSGADDVRNRLAAALEQEGERLRATRAELVTIRTELVTLNSTGFPTAVGTDDAPTGVGTLTPGSTSVPGSAQAGLAAGLPPLGPLSVSMPDLTGLDAGSLSAPVAGAAAAGLVRGARGSRAAATGMAPIGGMGAGAMGARAGSAARGSGSRAGAGGRRLTTPRLSDTDADDEQTRAARERSAEKDAKRATLEEKRAERAARRAARLAEREGDHDPALTRRAARDRDRDDRDDRDPADELDDDLDDDLDDELDEERDGVDRDVADAADPRSASADLPGEDRGSGRR